MILKLRILLIAGGLLLSTVSYAQENLGDEPTDDLGNVTDDFQEAFFEALKQKAIENYELALESLQKAEKAANGNSQQLAVVNYEIGKNLVKIRRYNDAEPYFVNTLTTTNDRLDVMESLYNLYYLQRDYDKAIPLVKKLIVKDSDYKEDLANLYARSKQYDEALAILDQLDIEEGESTYRNSLRSSIYKRTGNNEAQIEKLETKVDANPKKEQDYLNLIYLYSDEGNTAKAFETAKELLKNNPKSELVHLALYKFYLENNETDNAIKSMEAVFKAQGVDKESKYKVMGDFISFVETNPQYEQKLEQLVSGFAEDNGRIYEKLGDYYVAKNRNEDALDVYKKALKMDDDNYSLIKSTLAIQIELGKFDDAAKTSTNALDVFPAQPLLYLFNGVANIGLQKADNAIEVLETGVDYIIDNHVMEKDFYTQLERAYTLNGDTKKAASYAKKAASIVIN